MEAEDVVAARYGIEGGAWEALRVWKPLRNVVSQYRTELDAKGHTFKLLAKGMAEDVLKDLYVRVKQGDLAFSQMMDFLSIAMKAGGLEPQKTDGNANLQTGPAFTIEINLGGPAPTTTVEPQGRVIDVTPEAA